MVPQRDGASALRGRTALLASGCSKTSTWRHDSPPSNSPNSASVLTVMVSASASCDRQRTCGEGGANRNQPKPRNAKTKQNKTGAKGLRGGAPHM
eukprot:SAG31_NODE_4319_length_3362_cov_2.182041_4_plen_95_part_00